MSEVPTLVPTRFVPTGVEENVPWLRAVRQRQRGPSERPQAATSVQGESGVVGAVRAGVGHVHEAVVLGDAHRLDAVRGDDPVADELKCPVALDPEDRDLVAARVHREHIASVTGDLDSALRRQAATPVPAPPVSKGEPASGLRYR
jgi:hypothetical protein